MHRRKGSLTSHKIAAPSATKKAAALPAARAALHATAAVLIGAASPSMWFKLRDQLKATQTCKMLSWKEDHKNANAATAGRPQSLFS